MNGFALKKVISNQYIDVTINNNLKWDKHVDNICCSPKRTLGYLKRNFKHASPSAKILVYRTVIQPVLEYSSVIWDPHTKRHIQKVEKAQRLAACYILSRYKQTDSAWTGEAFFTRPRH